MADIPVGTLRHQDQLRQALMEAIEHDDPGKINALVQRGAPLYQHYYHKPTEQLGSASGDPHLRDLGLVNPVDWAVLELRFRAAMQLLELGDGRHARTEARPRPAALGEHGLAAETKVALSLAALHGHLGLMRMLLERGTFVGQANLDGMSALHVALAAGKAEAASLLLQYGAWDVEERAQEVRELAWERKLAGVFTSAGLTLEVGGPAEGSRAASPKPPRAPQPGTPSAGARREAWHREGHSNAMMQEHVQRPTQSPRPDGLADWGWAPFQTLPSTALAAAGGGAVSVPRPGSSAASHELTTEEVRLRGELHRSIRKGELDKIRGLVVRGAPLDACWDLGHGERGNCLDLACVAEHPESALVLLELADEQGLGDHLAVGAKSALFWSVSQGYLEVLQELLRRGADVAQHSPLGSLKSVNGQSLLAVAVFGARKAETLELLKHGAWEQESEAQREQLLTWAASRKSVAEAFREAGVCGFTEVLAPLNLPYREHGIWEPNYPRPVAQHWEAEAETANPEMTMLQAN